ncbi:hypothetical protein F7725_027327 [Dissostichus mawsoni]|uniref:Transmembrane protein n=1 Tax=Dissostichus mawsoni TaxID=36200 RepID=A0A7J5XDI5_DISMA|nr:hypothetical protein F7725_027327 [Dissostichus mawsoni]
MKRCLQHPLVTYSEGASPHETFCASCCLVVMVSLLCLISPGVLLALDDKWEAEASQAWAHGNDFNCPALWATIIFQLRPPLSGLPEVTSTGGGESQSEEHGDERGARRRVSVMRDRAVEEAHGVDKWMSSDEKKISEEHERGEERRALIQQVTHVLHPVPAAAHQGFFPFFTEDELDADSLRLRYNGKHREQPHQGLTGVSS